MARPVMYLRKSRADNASETIQEVLAKHEGILQEYAQREYGAPIPAEDIYREVVSGETISDRPMMQRLLQALETGTVSQVLVVDPQRLTRGDLEDCGRVVNSFRYTRVPVVTPMKTYDLQDKYDRKFFEMELMRGNDYLEYTKEILLRGRIASVKRGYYINSSIPYGYSRLFLDPAHRKGPTLTPDPAEAPAVKLAFDLFVNQGISVYGICVRLEELGFTPRRSAHWRAATLRDMLSNPVYAGKIRWGWRATEKAMDDGEIISTRPRKKDYLLVDGIHEPLVDGETFARAQELLKKNARVRNDTTIKNPLATLLYCQCGRTMPYHSYHSSRGIQRNRYGCTDQRHCGRRSVKADDLQARVIRSLQKTLDNYRLELAQDNSGEILRHQETVAAITAKLEELHHREDQQFDLLESGVYTKDVFLRRNKKLADQRQALELSLQTLMDNAPTQERTRSIVRQLSDALEALTDPTVPPTRQNFLLKQVIDRIVYYTDQKTLPPGGKYPPHTYTLDIQLKF